MSRRQASRRGSIPGKGLGISRPQPANDRAKATGPSPLHSGGSVGLCALDLPTNGGHSVKGVNSPWEVPMPRTRRSYTAEFKTEAVKLVTEQGYSVAEAARSLGIGPTLLRSWKQTLQSKGADAFPGQGKLPAVEDQLRRLRAENQRLRAERDILKKAAAYFAREAL